MTTAQSAASRVSSRWSFSQWPLRRKLAAALIFPVALAFVLGGLRVKSDVDQAQQFAQAADVTVLLRPVVEYNIAVQRLAAAQALGGDGLAEATKVYDVAAAAVAAALTESQVSDTVRRQVTDALGLGKAVRVATAQKGAGSVAMDKSATVSGLVSSIVGGLGLNDVSSVQTLVGLQDAIAAQRAMTAQQLNLSNTDDAAGGLAAVEQVGAEGSFLSRLKDQGSQERSAYVRQLINENDRRGIFLQGGALDESSRQLVADGYQRSTVAFSGLFDRQLSDLENALRASANEHRAQAIVSSGLVVAALLAALVIVVALLRSLLTPLRVLRESALDVARTRLPEALRRIRDGEEAPAAEPIPIHTTEEMGQLARAVDDLHAQALGLAGEQARLRVQVGHMFETLSRRSTSLIDQQLTLIERLERDEEDPTRLQSLFRLDHLAARMRRNSDSLLVLAGTSTRRGLSGSVAVSDAVQAAVSEVENYQRIDIGQTSDDQVLASVGSDLIHMIAEVVDNALAYSPPSSRVDINGNRTPDGGLLIEVRDHGLGMPPAELAALNERLADGTDITADTARRMGLFVVGSLAQRHGISVRLRRNNDADKNGITVSLHLPAHLLAQKAAAAPARPGSGQRPAAGPAAGSTPSPAGLNGSAAPAATPNGSANGSPSTGLNGLPVRKPMATGITELTGNGGIPTLPRRGQGEGASGGPTPLGGLPRRGTTPPAAKDAEAGATADAQAAGTTDTGTPAAQPAHGRAEAKAAQAAQAEAAARARSTEADGRPTPAAPEHTAAEAPAAPEATAAEAPAEPEATAPEAPAEPEATAAELPAEPEATAPEPPAAPEGASPEVAQPAPAEPEADAPAKEGRRFGLPVRKPNATRITEHSGGPVTRPEAAAPAEPAAPAEHRMPANLSAWLDHRAKLAEVRARADAEAAEAAEQGAAAADSPEGPHASATPEPARPVDAPAAAPAEVPADPPAGATSGLPVRRPGASGVFAAGLGPSQAEPATASGPGTERGSATDYLGARRSHDAAPVEQPVADDRPQAAEQQPGETALTRDAESPIFRSMMSRWLADPVENHQSVSWSPNAADEGWNAAARLESEEQLEESSAGLPMRRPGDHLVPGTIETTTAPAQEEVAPTTTGRRDPEAIRRNLNRHQGGVRSARADALNGTQ